MRRILSTVWILLGLMSCAWRAETYAQGDPAFATLMNRLAPVTDAASRAYVLGCSVLPPGRELWSLAIDDDAQELLFWRGMSSPTRSTYARVSATWMDNPPTSNETLRSLIQRTWIEPGGERFTDSQVRFEEDTSRATAWVRFAWTASDWKARGYEGQHFVMTTHGILFLHPDAPHLLISIRISERVGPSDSPTDTAAIKVFLDSLRITRPDASAVRSFPTGLDPNAILFAHGSLWISCEAPGSQGQRGELVRFDPVGLAVTSRIPLNGKGVGIAATEDAVWVSLPDRRKLVRIDSKSNAIDRSVTCGKQPWMLASAGNVLFVVDGPGGALWKLDGESGRPLGAPNRDVGNPRALTLAEGLVWVTDIQHELLWSIDPTTLQTRGNGIRIGSGAFDVKAGGGSVWVKCFGSKSILRVNPSSREVVATIPTPGPWASGLTFAADRLWVCDYTAGTLGCLNPTLNRFSEQAACVGVRPGNIAATEDALWINDRSSGELRRFVFP